MNYRTRHPTLPNVVEIFVSLLIAAYVWISGYCFHYSLGVILEKDVPWYIDLVVGIFFGVFVIPIAFVCWLYE